MRRETGRIMEDKRLVKKIRPWQYRIIKPLFQKYEWAKKYTSKLLIKCEKGEMYSYTMRQLFSELYDIRVGFGSYGWWWSGFRPNCVIGAYCTIGKGIKRFSRDRNMKKFSTHSFFQREKYGFFPEDVTNHTLHMGNDVSVGSNVLITAGCENIGDGAMIETGSVVTHDIPAYAIAQGNPAVIVGYRFCEEDRKKLMESRWYELSPEELSKIKETGDDVDAFVSAVGKIRRSRS